MAFKIAHFTNIPPHYREALWLDILNDEEFQFHFYFGKSSVSGIKSIDFDQEKWNEVKEQLHTVKNFTLFGRLIFQFGVISQVLLKKWDAVILLEHFHIVSNWITVFILKLRGIPVVTWGHGMYGNEKGLKKHLMRTFLNLANTNLVYSHFGKKQLVVKGLDKKNVVVIYNSLDYQKSIDLREKALDENYYQRNRIFKKTAPTLIFVGRLTPQKNIDWLIDAVKKLTNNGVKVNALVVGDGIERESLEKKAANLQNIQFYGSCYNEGILSKLIANADLCVSPGNVGLTAIHSLSYGTPVCTHNNFSKQMPEFEAIREGETGCFFDWHEKNIFETIEKWLSKDLDREEIRKACYKVIDSYYNPQNQVTILKDTIKNLI
jgi:glycosyltransferase involved in cell wall biosynthesis